MIWSTSLLHKVVGTAKHKSAIEKAKQVLEEKPYEVISLEDMQMVRTLLYSWIVDWEGL